MDIPSFRKKRLLVVVEDNAFQEVLTELLELEGFDVVSANNSEQAITLVKNIVEENPIDLVLVDSTSPEMGKVNFLHWLRQEAKLSQPVFVLSAYRDSTIAEVVRTSGATELISKPIEAEAFITQIKQVVMEAEKPRVGQPMLVQTAVEQATVRPQGRFVKWFRNIFGNRLPPPLEKGD